MSKFRLSKLSLLWDILLPSPGRAISNWLTDSATVAHLLSWSHHTQQSGTIIPAVNSKYQNINVLVLKDEHMDKSWNFYVWGISASSSSQNCCRVDTKLPSMRKLSTAQAGQWPPNLWCQIACSLHHLNPTGIHIHARVTFNLLTDEK